FSSRRRHTRFKCDWSSDVCSSAPEEQEWLYRLRKTCEGGLIAAELAEKDDELENALLAARITFKGEEMPLRTAQARLAVLKDYRERDVLGELHRRRSAEFNEQRLSLLRDYE